MKNSVKHLAMAIAVAALTQSASAIPTLTISDGLGNSVTISDNGAAVFVGTVAGAPADTVGLGGVVSWAGSLGTLEWVITVDTGVTKPVLGTATSPHMDLSYQATSIGAATMKIIFSDDGFTYSGGLVDSWGGTTASGAGNSQDNHVLVNGSSIIHVGPFGPGGFNGSGSAAVTLAPRDVLSLVVDITHTGLGVQVSSGNKDVEIPDGGTTIALLGVALMGIGGLRRKLRI